MTPRTRRPTGWIAVDDSARLPHSLKVLLKNLLRDEDGCLVATHVRPSDLLLFVLFVQDSLGA